MHQRPMRQLRMSLESRVTVLLLDDHALFRLGLRTLLEAQPMMTVVGEAATIAAAVERVATLRPALVISAATLADGDAGEACRRITVETPGTRVAVLSDGADEAAILRAMGSGASGCLSPRMRTADLCRKIRAIATGQSQPGRSIHARLEGLRGGGWLRGDPCRLTAQERRVLALVAEGRTNKEVALALTLSEKTVKNYLSNVFEKLQVSRRSQAAVLFARDQGRFLATSGLRTASPALRAG